VNSKFDPQKDKEHEHRNSETIQSLFYDDGLNLGQVAQELNTTDSVIRKWMDKFEIKKPINNSEYLNKQREQGKSAKEIADEINEHWTDVYTQIEQAKTDNES